MKHVLKGRIQQLLCCRDVSIPDFKSAMHQWANTLTSSGQNMPFSLPIRTDKLADGFQVCSAVPSLRAACIAQLTQHGWSRSHKSSQLLPEPAGSRQ